MFILEVSIRVNAAPPIRQRFLEEGPDLSPELLLLGRKAKVDDAAPEGGVAPF
jgi:hypothetical protein